MSYQTLRARLVRELKAIRKTRGSLRKTKQIAFMKLIYDKVLKNNPFKSIDIGRLPRRTTRVGNQVIVDKTVGQTEYVSSTDPSKGIRVKFDEEVFKGSLESIINTALHEAAHARQLKRGIPYRSFVRPGRAKIFAVAVTALAEVDAYLLELKSPYFARLSSAEKSSIRKSLALAEKEAVESLKRLDLDMLRPYQMRLEAILPKFTGLRKYGWFAKHPLPWKTKATTR